MGIEGYNRKSGTKTGMTSKGGSIGKKEREVLSMAKGSMGYDQGQEAVAAPAKEKEKGK